MFPGLCVTFWSLHTLISCNAFLYLQQVNCCCWLVCTFRAVGLYYGVFCMFVGGGWPLPMCRPSAGTNNCTEKEKSLRASIYQRENVTGSCVLMLLIRSPLLFVLELFYKACCRLFGNLSSDCLNILYRQRAEDMTSLFVTLCQIFLDCAKNWRTPTRHCSEWQRFYTCSGFVSFPIKICFAVL